MHDRLERTDSSSDAARVLPLERRQQPQSQPSGRTASSAADASPDVVRMPLTSERHVAARRAASDVLKLLGERYAGGFRTYECNHPGQREVLTMCRDWAEQLSTQNASKTLVLFGPCGTGKDHLALAVAMAAVKASLNTNDPMLLRVANGRDVFARLRDGMDAGDAERLTLAPLQNAGMLVLSDPCGVGTLTPWQFDVLYRVVDARYVRCLPTIVTLNAATIDAAEQQLGFKTFDRLAHGAWLASCQWPSYRRPARQFIPS